MPFCDFVASSALRTGRSFETALAEQRRADDLLGVAVQKVLDQAKSARLQYYELWKIQMERIRRSFKSVSIELTARLGKSYSIDFLEYSMLGFDQFETLLERRNPGEQWFFKVKIRPFAGTPTEYVFWFGWAGELVRNYTGRPAGVSLRISKKVGSGEWLTMKGPGAPTLREVFERDGRIHGNWWLEEPGQPIRMKDPDVIATEFFTEALQALGR